MLATPESFRLTGGIGFCNAVRRTLLSDVRSEAPCRITMHVNSTCETDEFLAHRIGMIPFRRVGNGDTMSLDCTGPCTVTAASFVGPAFTAVYESIEVMRLGSGHQLKLTVFFDEQAAASHARYSVCHAVGMSHDADGACVLRFGSNCERTPKQLLLEALGHLDDRVGRALLSLANQPATPPQSFC